MRKTERIGKLLTAILITAVLFCAGAVVVFAEEPENDGGAVQNIEAAEAIVEPAEVQTPDLEEVTEPVAEAEANGDVQELEKAVSPAAEPQADGNEPDGNSMTYGEVLTAISALEGYAAKYLKRPVGSTSVNRLVMNYIRSDKYNGTLWNIVAGKVNDGFVRYVGNKVEKTAVEGLRDIVEFAIPDVGQTDFVHMFASMDAYANGFKNFGGWYGDLAQVMVVVANIEGTKYDIRKAYEEAFKMINAEGTLFNKYDVVADFQAYSIMKLLASDRNMKVSCAFKEINETIANEKNEEPKPTSLHVMSELFLRDCLGLSSGASFTKIASRLALVTVKDAVLVTALGALEKGGPVRVSSAVRIGCRLAFAKFLYDNVNSYEKPDDGNVDGAVQTNINEDNLEREIDAAIAQAEEALAEEAA